jgi:hypothetical protein
MQFLIVGEHPPNLCPSANAAVRALVSEGGQEMPALAERLGVRITATYVPMTNHLVFVAVEADSIEAAREFAWQGRLSQWNKVEIYPVSTLEEAVGRAQELPTVY